jgi:predicted transposase/invertase (TIGR01784 family)
LAFDLLKEEAAYRNSYGIRNDESGNLLCPDMKIIYLELPKFLRALGPAHPRTGLERWLLYFSNEEGTRMEKAIAEDSVLSMAQSMELEFWADERERELYFQHQQLLMDAYSDEHTYEVLLKQETERAAQEGRKQGLEQGLEQGKLEVARNLLRLGFKMEQAVQASGLSEEEIRRNLL